MNHSLRRVVVTGMGAVTPIGLSVDEFWRALLCGVSGAAPITAFDAAPLDTRFACELKGFDPLNYMDRKTARRVDPFCQYALVASAEALADAHLDTSALTTEQRERIGVSFGSSIGGVLTYEKLNETYRQQGPRHVSPASIPAMMANMASAHLSIHHGFRGPNLCVVSACATGNHNIGDAFFAIQRGDADAMLCGGSEAGICEIIMAAFCALRALSTRNDSPATASRPFDATRDGFVMGEGAGALFLESLEHAQARGAYIYAEMLGIGTSADAYHITVPSSEGQQRAMNKLLRNAGITPHEVDYINLHGTSTPLGDVAETETIKSVLGEHAYAINVSSTKSMTGHLLGAAGAVEAIATILAILHDTIPPTINFAEADPQCDLNYTFNKPVERPVHLALSNAFAFGGHNTSIAFREWEE
jgi:3-oxoacyl-[acyl-carrier-protein] synthase II